MTIHYLLSNNQYAYIINFIPTLTAHLSVLIDSYIQELQHTFVDYTFYYSQQLTDLAITCSKAF